MNKKPGTVPTLTDRYVWGVLRSVPSGDRAELEREVRALVADAIDVKSADATLDAGAAERAALTELGDPGVLATRYSGQITYLLGPEVFPVWRGIVTVVLAIVVPVVAIASGAGALIGGAPVVSAIVGGLGAASNVAVHTLFWFTLVFAILERIASSKERQALMEAAGEVGRAGITGGFTVQAASWTLDDLPALPDGGRMGLGELAAAIVANVAVIVTLLWLQIAQPVVIDGQAFPLFDPALESFALPWFAVIALVEIALTVAVYRRGQWTYAFAAGNALLGAAFAIPGVWLLANDLLLNPAVVAALHDAGAWLAATKSISAVVVVAIVAWDAIDGFRKAHRAVSSASSLG